MIAYTSYALRLPDISTATPSALFNVADVAAPLSPLKLLAPVPAIVEMTLVGAETLRIRLLP